MNQILQVLRLHLKFWEITLLFSNANLQNAGYMTRVEGENTRLRHYLARLHRKTLCSSKSVDMLAHSVRLLLRYLKFGDVPTLARFIS